MTGPHIDQLARDQLADLGLVDGGDHTEDLRPMKNAPAGAGTPTRGDQNHPAVTTTDKEL